MMVFVIAAVASFAFDVPPWEGTTLGAEDTVPPPWTAPAIGERTFSCWGREYDPHRSDRHDGGREIGGTWKGNGFSLEGR